ncbi:acetyl-CoA acetyltransferase [Cohnella rhizosphaerae]|uniref:Acetyl-CoA acetyltransferase n=1 Tax=Cohnella rhizosphaerae TaxID=1457232 RepID=A0A9X4KWR1_9BACL|nr:acetyl-CoA acetyltransferase [Cohnella rhizosphaerae]MDG0811756.1 acetyl-CoA acetyltransferase [Cohnella rhizosphaerae]
MTSKSKALDTSAPIYEADQDWVAGAKQIRQKLSDVCGAHHNRNVRVKTIDGHAYEGTVVGVDGCHLHLAVAPSAMDARFFGPFAANAILTLVLYELLVITLLI